tara:strand:+ start:15027 stop:16445 length:1419 start_codon:yes stop_codon:yes gene_type:complete
MAFTLETDFLARPARSAPESQNQASAKDRKGADFKESLSKLDTAKHRDEVPENLDRSETGQTAVAAILINDPTQPPRQSVSPDAELPEFSAEEVVPEASHELIEVLSVGDTVKPAPAIAADDMQATPAPVDTAPIPTERLTLPEPLPMEPVQQGGPEAVKLEAALLEPATQDNVAISAPPSDADIATGDTLPDPAVQSTLASAAAAVQAPANGGPASKTESADAKVNGTGALAAPASQPALQASSAGAPGNGHRSNERFASDAPPVDPARTASTPQHPEAASFSDIVVTDKAAISQDMNVGVQPINQQTQTPQLVTTATPNGLTPANALISATPAEIVDVISDSLATPDDRKNRIVVQLDPPELGRVSIDYKFDSHGLQHVTITGESPEAMRQLRLMHFELVNALEKQGLSSQNMSFQQQQQAQQDPNQQGPRAGRLDADVTGNQALTVPTLIASQTSRPGSTSSSGLNIKL